MTHSNYYGIPPVEQTGPDAQQAPRFYAPGPQRAAYMPPGQGQLLPRRQQDMHPPGTA